jgi:hypothetical protein
MEFEQELHARTGRSLLRASEELIETLEENQVFNMWWAVLSVITNIKEMKFDFIVRL